MRFVQLSRKRLCEIALLSLLIPHILFLVTWVRIEVMLLSCVALIISFILFVRGSERLGEIGQLYSNDRWVTTWIVILACLACAALWTFLSGIGGFFYQNDDFYGRNAIFHDMLEHSWPVYFEGTDYALTYYIGYWVVPALLGKICALIFGQQILWISANYFLYFETVWFLFLIFLIFLSLLDVRSIFAACGFLLFFVMFSGMDGMVCFLRHDWTDQIEWWAQTWQYSSHTTCLFWVFNQALPAWLATLVLICMSKRVEVYACIGLSILIYSPLPLVGFVFICVGLFVELIIRGMGRKNKIHTVKENITRAFSPCNLLAILGSIPCFFYLKSNAASGNAPFRVDMFLNAYSLPMSILRLIVFNLVEWAVYALIIIPVWHKDALLRISIISLAVIPIFRVGYHMDFSMRASIPGLLILSVYCAKHLKNTVLRKQWIKAGALIVVLLIGSITPMLEFQRGAYRVMRAGTNRIFSDPYQTVLHPYADTDNFICEDIKQSFFYMKIAR